MIRFVPQHDQMDCGPASLAMIAGHFGKRYPLEYLRNLSFITREGVSIAGISHASISIGLCPLSAQLPVKYLIIDNDTPCILHWNQNHFVVLYRIKKNILTKKYYFKIADPAHGFITLSQDKFEKHWASNKNKGIALFLHPTSRFFEQQPPKQEKHSIKYLFGYLKPYKSSLLWMVLLLLFGSIISLIFPYLTQTLIDKGVNGKDLDLITLILIAQLVLYSGSLIIELLRNWIMLVVGTKINIKIISEYLKKILKLPIRFFDSKLMGDFSQRISDHERIENFLTSQSLLTFFSMITFLVFFGVLWYYSPKILYVYLGLSVLAVLWSLFWLKKRKRLDYFIFQSKGENLQSIYEIISGVTEMKLNQYEDYKRNEWENLQQKIFKINIRLLKLNQVQLTGFDMVNQVKNIVVTYIAASLVVTNSMTLGTLLSVSYIIGQMNSPIDQLMNFFQSMQDAKLSLARLNEVQNYDEEDTFTDQYPIHQFCGNIDAYDIRLADVSFQYEGPQSPFVLKKINIHIRAGEVTAIVGASGSGKTTLMKLLLRFYDPVEGTIFLDKSPYKYITHKWLRERCGVVMQEGYIFGDTIERNIVCGDKKVDKVRLQNAVKIANIEHFISSLPLGLNTKIGASGCGISGGQRQRILIARAVYKDPMFLFLDEATSSLDSENEKVIHDNLQEFLKGKTAVIIAHRLSTVKNADKIVVLRDGSVVEFGTHYELVSNKTVYYDLVKNQLELGT